MIGTARRPFGSLGLAQGRPPRLLVKALTVTFVTVSALLAVVFFLVRMTVRDQVRQTVADNLDASQRMVAALERRRLQ